MSQAPKSSFLQRDSQQVKTANPMLDEDLEGNDDKGEKCTEERWSRLGAIFLVGLFFLMFFIAIGYDQPKQNVISPTEAPVVVTDNPTRFPTSTPPELSSRQPDSVFVHLFEWTWKDIERECVEFLGPKGYSAVQVSPVQEHIDHTRVNESHTDIGDFMPWYARYQPVSYKLESRSGSREEFEQMVETCQSVGVDIYVDILLNHMAATPTEFGNAGTPFDPSTLDFVDYEPEHFHTCNPPDIQNEDYGNKADRVRLCRLVGLPDLDQKNAFVQQKLIDHIQDLVDLGVKGLRLDAGKHMFVEDVNFLLEAVNAELYIFSEIIDYGNDAISVNEYAPFYDITEFRYEGTLNNKFKESILADLKDIGEKFGFLRSDDAVVFTDNHDSQRHSGHLSYKDGVVYDLANVFMLAHPYGYPKVMSSYEFEQGAQGPPSFSNGKTKSVFNEDGSMNCGNGEWVCEHRRPYMANMVAFRKHCRSLGANRLANWNTNNFQEISFSVVDKFGDAAGWVAINKEDFSFVANVASTSLPDGTYCDILDGEIEDNICTGRTIEVSSGSLSVELQPFSATAIHTGAMIRL